VFQQLVAVPLHDGRKGCVIWWWFCFGPVFEGNGWEGTDPVQQVSSGHLTSRFSEQLANGKVFVTVTDRIEQIATALGNMHLGEGGIGITRDGLPILVGQSS